ncbi:MgtC/SapB family protein [Sedimentitalea sp. JM2-8]|uniref:Protein MgtC n=1 Tax=Sedimentitalea xiamensis TaxID=3050037 RepID=A0ABT7FKL9_9RHOB|nr:MgtC/SapB family protein [Sedimentitalea xiamensis]MDK3075515.1 MgtC/SapB family protein [Sedimentitalea xiamensis]
MTSALLPSEFFWSAVIKFALAVFCGGLIGVDRQLRGKPAGIRICIVLVLTTTFMADLGSEITKGSGDPSRVLGAIITGIGFLGGGVIFAQGGRVQGMTTATLIWALAAIGTSIGLGYRYSAVAMTLLLMAVVFLTDWAEARFPGLRPELEPGSRDPQE